MGHLSKPLKLGFIGIDPGKMGAIALLLPDGDKWKATAQFMPTVTTSTRKKGLSPAGKPKYSRKTEYDRWKLVQLIYEFLYTAQDLCCDCHIAIENQQARPTDSKGNVFATAQGFGMLEMAVITARALLARTQANIWSFQEQPGMYHLVSPTAWKPRYVQVGADKAASVTACRRLYPDLPLPLVKDEAKAEAVLIADYCLRTFYGLDFPNPRKAPGRKATSKDKVVRKAKPPRKSNKR